MKQLKKLEEIVLAVLRRNLVARKDDFILYGGILKEMGFDLFTPIGTALAYHKHYHLPSFESVSRCRRHIQELEQDLKDDHTAVVREEAEEMYKMYNRSGLCD